MRPESSPKAGGLLVKRRFSKERIIGVLREQETGGTGSRSRDFVVGRPITPAWRCAGWRLTTGSVETAFAWPRSTLGYMTPEEFASPHRGHAPDGMTTSAKRAQYHQPELSSRVPGPWGQGRVMENSGPDMVGIFLFAAVLQTCFDICRV
jgi:hypothetical protein